MPLAHTAVTGAWLPTARSALTGVVDRCALCQSIRSTDSMQRACLAAPPVSPANTSPPAVACRIRCRCCDSSAPASTAARCGGVAGTGPRAGAPRAIHATAQDRRRIDARQWRPHAAERPHVRRLRGGSGAPVGSVDVPRRCRSVWADRRCALAWPQESLCSDFSASVYMMGHLDLALPLDIDRVRLSCGDDRALDPCNTHAHSRSKWDLGVSGIGRLGGAVSGTLSRTLTAGPDRPRRCDANASVRAGLPLCARGRGGQQGKARPCVACHTRAGRAVAPCHHSRAAAQEVSWGGRRRRDPLSRASRDADAQARLAAAEAGVRARGRQPAVHAAGSGRRRRDAPRVQAQVRPAMRALARGRSGRGALVH
jgi:hypothetical protein